MAKTDKGNETVMRLVRHGLTVWREEGYAAVTARRIAADLNMSHASALYHFKTAQGLIYSIAIYAVQENDSVVVPQLITMNHPAVQNLTKAEKQRHLAGFHQG